MQKIFNIVLWIIVAILIIGLIIINLLSNNKIYEYRRKFDTTNYGVEIRIFGTKKSNSKREVNILENKYKDKNISIKKFLTEVSKYLSNNNINNYLVVAKDNVLVGKHYNNSKYEIATTKEDKSIFKILKLEDKVLIAEYIKYSNLKQKVFVLGNDIEEVYTFIEELNKDTNKEVSEDTKLYELE